MNLEHRPLGGWWTQRDRWSFLLIQLALSPPLSDSSPYSLFPTWGRVHPLSFRSRPESSSRQGCLSLSWWSPRHREYRWHATCIHLWRRWRHSLLASVTLWGPTLSVFVWRITLWYRCILLEIPSLHLLHSLSFSFVRSASLWWSRQMPNLSSFKVAGSFSFIHHKILQKSALSSYFYILLHYITDVGVKTFCMVVLTISLETLPSAGSVIA